MPYRLLAGLLALILAAGLIWYSAIFLLAPGSGVQLRDLSGDRAAMQGITLTGRVQDNTWEVPFTVADGRVQNGFVPRAGSYDRYDTITFYYALTPMPAPGADTSEPVAITDAGGTMRYQISTNEVAWYVNVWGSKGRELVLFDTGLRCHTDKGRYFFESTSRMIGDTDGHMIWRQSWPEGEDNTPENEEAYWEVHDVNCTIGRTRTKQYDLIMVGVGLETRVFRVDNWGSTLDIKEASYGTSHAFTDYTQPVGAVSETSTLPGMLRRAGRTSADTAVAVVQSGQGLTACALDAAGFLTDQTQLLTAEEAGEPCNVLVVTAAAGTGFADIGLLLEPNGPAAAADSMAAAEAALAAEQTPRDTCPWAAALRVENGRFTAAERVPLNSTGNASRFLAAGLDETGTRLVTVQQLLPLREEQPPVGVRGREFHLAGEVSTAVWQAGEKLYEGVLEGDWREDAWRKSYLWNGYGFATRSITFGEIDNWGKDCTAANLLFYQYDGEVEYQ